jgi:hypothetical protein
MVLVRHFGATLRWQVRSYDLHQKTLPGMPRAFIALHKDFCL